MILCTINVHHCDGCKAIAVLSTDEDCTNFADTWFAGDKVDFCPACRDLAKNQPAIIRDEKQAESIPHSAGSPPYKGGVAPASGDGVVLSPRDHSQRRTL